MYIGVSESSKVSIEATIYADSLPEPASQCLTIDFDVKKDQIDAIELLERMRKKRGKIAPYY